MNVQKTILGLMAALVLTTFSLPAAAESYGGSGEIDAVNSASQTIDVGSYTLMVVATSVMIDETGRTMSFADLHNVIGNVSFTMKKKGTRWELVKLVVEEEEEDEEDY